MRNCAALIGATAVLLTLLAVPAVAHTELVTAAPADGAQVDEALDDVILTFDHAVSDVTAELRGPDGQAVAAELVQVGPTRLPEPHEELQLTDGEWVETVNETGYAAQLRIPEVQVGTQTLVYTAVAEDGHPVEGELSYEYGGPVGAIPAAPVARFTPPPTSPTPTPAPAAVRPPIEPADEEVRTSTTDGMGLLPLVGVLVVAGVALGAVMVRMRTTRVAPSRAAIPRRGPARGGVPRAGPPRRTPRSRR